MRVLGIPLESPQAVLERTLSDLHAMGRLARTAPSQIARLLDLAEDGIATLHALLELAERLDIRAESIVGLGERLDAQARAMVDLGTRMESLGERIDTTGIEIAGQASQVVSTATELIGVLPALEKAIELAIPLEGAIDRVGRFVDRLPGSGATRRGGGSESPTR
jgi:hypothetical protein